MSQESNTLAKPSVKVRGWVDPFHPQATAFGCVMAGTTVADAISKACKLARTRKRYQRRGLVYLGRKTAQGDYKWTRIPQSAWNKVRLKPNDSLTFRLLPEGGGGGKNPLRMILNIVVMAVAVMAAVFTAGASIFAAGGMLAGATIGTAGLTVGGLIAGSLVGGLVMTLGQMLVDKIAPIKQPSLSTTAADKEDVYSLSGSSNTIDRWGTVPILFGKGNFAPKKAAAPYTELDGDDMYLHELFIWGECGSGDIDISNIRIGETSVDDYDEIEINTWRYDPSDPWYSNLYPTGVHQEDLSLRVKASDGYIVRHSKDKATKISVDFNFSSLVQFDNKGNAKSTSVTFEVGYRKSETDNWTTLGSNNVAGDSFTLPKYAGCFWVYVDTDTNTLKAGEGRYDRPPSDVIICRITSSRNIEKYKTHIRSGFEYTTVTETRTDYDREGTAYSYEHILSITVKAGVWAWNKGTTTITASSSSPVRRTFTIGGLDGVSSYDVRVKRITADHDSEEQDDQKIQDDSYWTAIRTHTNDKPFNISYPAVFTAIRAKATDQLNGSISNLTGDYQVKMKNYNQAKKQWEVSATRDLIPAIRFALQEASARPQPDSVIDWDNFIETDAYWKSLGWKYDKVLDSQTSVLNMVQDICAAGLASPTFIDGKWAVIVDKPRDEVVMGITSANSWGWSVDRVTAELPDIIQCDFINENTWESDMMEVEVNSSYKDEGRTPIYEKVTFDGVTIPDNIYKQARFHYADAKTQVRTISMTMWDESLVATRGDLVSLSHPYLIPTGLEAGRIKSVTRDENGYITKVTTDILNTIHIQPEYPNREIGIKVYMSNGSVCHARVRTEITSEAIQTKTLEFDEAITADIRRGDKYILGDYTEEDFLGVITSMKFNADLTCQLTCVDYIGDKYNAIDPDFVVPPFTSVITKPIYAKTVLTPSPIVQDIITDERVLIRSGSGIKSRALVLFGVPPKLDNRATSIRCSFRIHNTLTDGDSVVPGKWEVFATIPVSETQAFCDNVQDKQHYDFRFQYVSSTGYTSEWTYVNNVEVIGRTSPPDNVSNFKAILHDPYGITLSWDAVNELDLDYYEVSGSYYATVKNITTTLFTPISRVGELEFNVCAVDTLKNKSKVSATATVTVEKPAIPTISSARLLDEGVVVQWDNAKTSWSIERYELKSGDSSVSSTGLRAVLPVSAPFSIGSTVTVRAKDIFNNYGEYSEGKKITCYYPKTPEVVLGCDPLTGNVTIDWQDCRNDDVVGAPSISHYEITGTLTDNRTVSVTGTHYESVVPLVVYKEGVENGVIVRAINVNVTAVDKYGVSSKSKSTPLPIDPPLNPTDFGVSASIPDGTTDLDPNWTDGGVIVLTWNDCKTTFNISHYVVDDPYTQTTYKVSTNYVVLPVRPEGDYVVNVTAYDVLGQSSAPMSYNLCIGGVRGFAVTAKIDGSYILVEWDTPSATFAIDHYIIMDDNDVIPTGTNADIKLKGFLGTAKTNYFRIPAGSAGTYGYHIWAVDVAGNVSKDYASYTSGVKVIAPLAPNVGVIPTGNGVTLQWTPVDSAGTLPIVSWEVRRYKGTVASGDIDKNTAVDEYGWMDSTIFDAPAFEVGTYTFAVRAKDSGGNEGKWGVVEFTAYAPSSVIITEPVIIDNNVHLYWRSPATKLFDIKEYIVSEVQDDYEMEIGRADALYFSISEEKAGTYTYRIKPVDIAGNIGKPTDRVCIVSQPPDFTFYDKVDSQFGGGNAKPSGTNGRTNFVLDGMGHMIGPVVVNETWKANISRVSASAGTTITTHQQKVDAGFTTWLEPYLASATYVETTDHGTMVPSCNLKVTITSRTIKKDTTVTPAPVFSCKVEVGKLAEDGKTINWTVATEDGMSVYVTDFRYSRVTVTVSHGYVEISNILIDLNIKKQTDFGRALVEAKDFATTQGTYIPFSVDFVDIQSLPNPRVVGYPDYNAFINFDGSQINPKGFYVYVLDKDGNPKTAEVEWVAYGV